MSSPIEGELPVGPELGQAPAPPLSLRQIGEVLVRHYGLTEGIFEVTVTFQLGVGAFGPDPENLQPTGFVGVHKLGLRRVPAGKPGPGLVDAAAVNGGKATPVKKKVTFRKKAVTG